MRCPEARLGCAWGFVLVVFPSRHSPTHCPTGGIDHSPQVTLEGPMAVFWWQEGGLVNKMLLFSTALFHRTACKAATRMVLTCRFGVTLTHMESKSHSFVSNSLQPHGLYSPWNSPGQNTGVGSRSPLKEIFPTQELNPDLPHCRQILYQLTHQGNPTHVEPKTSLWVWNFDDPPPVFML